MSVRTEADERLESARQHVVEAIRDLSAVLVGDCWGSDEYTTEKRLQLGDVMHTLMDIHHRDKI